MTIFQENYQKVTIGEAEAFRQAVEEQVSSVSFLNWKRGVFEPDSRWWGWLNDIFERFIGVRPYRI